MDHLGVGLEDEMKHEDDEPTTPITRVSIHPKHNHVIHCVIGFKNSIDVAALKHELSMSIMIKIPRFSSLLVVDPHDGTEQWKRTHVNLDNHIVIHHEHGHDHDQDHDHEPMLDEDAINSYLADIAILEPMSLDKPLWELHIMHAQKCLILRVHHAVADGMSLMSLLWSLDDSSIRNVHDDGGSHHDVMVSNNKNYHGVKGRSSKNMGMWEGLMFIWYSLVSVLKFIARFLWVKDKQTVISGIQGVEFWPRKVTTAKFQIGDMKTIKKAIPNATVNDVLYGILWCGLTRYLNSQHPKALRDGVQFTGLCPVNLRERPGVQEVSTMLSDLTTSWGNKFVMLLLPIIYSKRDMGALAYTARAKAVMDRKKRSMEARLCYKVGRLVFNCLGSKVGDLYYNLFSNTSFLVSNIAGPEKEISIASNPVNFIRVTSSSQPHAITLHMVSYAGKADLQIQVAKEVIHDPEFLAKCFEDALLEMKKDADNCVATKY